MATDYEKALQKQRTAAGLQGAATGASLGAGVGSVFGPVGTLVGAGVGALGGGLISGLSYEDDPLQVAQLKELQELQRRQELGMLGLTDAERAQLEAELIDPMRAARREQQVQFGQALSGADVGAGSYFKMAQGQEARVAGQEQVAREKIEARNLQEQKLEEARIFELLGEESKRAEAVREANLASVAAGVSGAVGAYKEASEVEAQEDLFAEMETELLSMSPAEQEQAQMMMMYQKYLYGGRN
jgi:hypothetical protein